MAKKIRIRRAAAWDVVEISALLFKGATEQGKDIWYPTPNVMKGIAAVLALIDQGLVVVAEERDEEAVHRRIIGAIGMTLCQDAWSDQWKLVNEWFYVDDKFRDTEVAEQLMTAVERFADTSVNPQTQEGLPVVMAMMTGLDTELKDELMRRRGYQYGGGNFVRKPNVQVQENDLDDFDSEVAGDAE